MSADILGQSFSAAGADFGDLNDDGYEDMAVHYSWGGRIEFWASNGDTVEPGFYEVSSMEIGYIIGNLALGDLDGDNDLDMLLKSGDWPVEEELWYYENQGTPEHFDFVLVSQNYQGITEGPRNPHLTDFDLDGDLDLVLGMTEDHRFWYYENQGTPYQANMVLTSEDLLGMPAFISPDFYDIDNDGDTDAVGGTIHGGLYYYNNITGQAVAPPRQLHPRHGIELSFGPNPANPVTWITFNLPYPQKAELAVYNLLGQKVATLASGYQMPGTRTYFWNASYTSSGSYFIRLETEMAEFAGKVVVLR
jgi:hypothetical protein